MTGSRNSSPRPLVSSSAPGLGSGKPRKITEVRDQTSEVRGRDIFDEYQRLEIKKGSGFLIMVPSILPISLAIQGFL